MRISKLAAAAFLGVAALGLSACANTLNTEVSRYQAMPAPQGQTFVVVPGEGMAANGGLEFQRYAGIVAQQLQARGYVPAASPQSASMTVSLGYGVDHGQVRVVDNSFGYGGYGPYGGSFFRSSRLHRPQPAIQPIPVLIGDTSQRLTDGAWLIATRCRRSNRAWKKRK